LRVLHTVITTDDCTVHGVYKLLS